MANDVDQSFFFEKKKKSFNGELKGGHSSSANIFRVNSEQILSFKQKEIRRPFISRLMRFFASLNAFEEEGYVMPSFMPGLALESLRSPAMQKNSPLMRSLK